MLLLNRRFYKAKNFLIGTLVVFVVIPALAMFAYIYWKNVQFTNEKLETSAEILMEHVSNNLDGEISRMEAYINMVANDTALVQRLEQVNYQQKNYALRKEFEYFNRYLNRLNLNGSILYNFLYISEKKDGFYFYKTYRASERENLKSQEWYQNTLLSRGGINWIDVSEQEGYPVIRCAKAIIDSKTYEITGVMVFEFLGQNIEILAGKNISSELWGILDEEGNFFYKSRGFRKFQEKHPEDFRELEQAEYKTVSSKEYLPLEETVNHEQWRIIQLMPRVSYRNELLQKGILLGVLLLLCMVIYVSYLMLLQKNFTVPLQSLVNLFNEMEVENTCVDIKKFSCYEMLKLSSGVITMVEKKKTSEAELESSKKKQDMLQADMLRARMNPHFIYNVLNTVKYRALLSGQPDITRILNALIKLLKGSINRDGEYYTLEEECKLIRDYVLIQSEIGKNEITLKENIEEEAWPCMVPCLILQPLVENAILYGIDVKDENNYIEISARADQERLYVSVCDNGNGISNEKMELLKNTNTKMSNIGLPGVIDRIKLIYGEQGQVNIQSAEGEGTKVEICIPVRK